VRPVIWVAPISEPPSCASGALQPPAVRSQFDQQQFIIIIIIIIITACARRMWLSRLRYAVSFSGRNKPCSFNLPQPSSRHKSVNGPSTKVDIADEWASNFVVVPDTLTVKVTAPAVHFSVLGQLFSNLLKQYGRQIVKRPLDGHCYCLELKLRNMFLPRRRSIIVQYFILLVCQDEKKRVE